MEVWGLGGRGIDRRLWRERESEAFVEGIPLKNTFELPTGKKLALIKSRICLRSL